MSVARESDHGEARPDPVEAGIQAGLERASRNEVDVPREVLEESLQDLRETVDAYQEPLNPRFVELYAENVAVAMAARTQYEHDRLNRDEIFAFLEYLGRFQNSWKHLVL
jgi:hypothetical protein